MKLEKISGLIIFYAIFEIIVKLTMIWCLKEKSAPEAMTLSSTTFKRTTVLFGLGASAGFGAFLASGELSAAYIVTTATIVAVLILDHSDRLNT